MTEWYALFWFFCVVLLACAILKEINSEDVEFDGQTFRPVNPNDTGDVGQDVAIAGIDQ